VKTEIAQKKYVPTQQLWLDETKPEILRSQSEQQLVGTK